MKPPRIEKLLMLAMAVTFVAPLPLTIYYACRHKGPPKWQAWLGNSKLAGMTTQTPEQPPFSWKRFFAADWQRGVEEKFNNGFAEREVYIRFMDEVSYRFLRMSPLASANIHMGRNGSLFETAYLDEYNRTRVGPEALAPLVTEVKQFQEACEKRGVAFVLLITPSKAAIYPGDMPWLYRTQYDSRPRAYDLFIPMLKEQGIHFVDGHAIAVEDKAQSPIPVFPRGGIHWNIGCAALTVNAVFDQLSAQGMSLRPLDLSGLSVTNRHFGEDEDLYSLSNLILDWDYPVEALKLPVLENHSRYRVALIGGSFTWKVGDLFARSCQFRDIDFYYYYKTSKWHGGADGKVTNAGTPAPPMDFAKDIYGVDCVVLEVNEQYLANPVNTLSIFLPDALANVPPAGTK